MKNVEKGNDGVYRWVYEMSLWKNPTILLLLWKIFFWICVGLWLFITLISVKDTGFWWSGFLDNTKFFGIFTLGMLLLCLIGYVVYAIVMGGKYCVMFEMDDKGVRHTQMEKQVKKAEVLSLLTVLAGAAAKNPTAVGAGLMSSAKTTMYSEFSKVKNVKVYRRRGVIKVNSTFEKNQVYAEKADFDFVLDFITSHAKKADIILKSKES